MTSPITPNSVPNPAPAVPALLTPTVAPASPSPAAAVGVTPSISRARIIASTILSATTLLSITLLLIATALWAYTLVYRYDFLRAQCLTCWIITGTAATCCLAAAMRCFNTLLHLPKLRWQVTLPLRLGKRLILLAQFATTGLVLAASVLLLFHIPIPSTDDSILYPSWSPPEDDPIILLPPHNLESQDFRLPG